MKSKNRILTDDWRKFDATKVIIAPKNLSSEKLLKNSNQLQKKYTAIILLSAVLYQI